MPSAQSDQLIWALRDVTKGRLYERELVRQAFADDELLLYYQPIVRTEDASDAGRRGHRGARNGLDLPSGTDERGMF